MSLAGDQRSPTVYATRERRDRLRREGFSTEQIAVVWKAEYPHVSWRKAMRWAAGLAASQVVDQWGDHAVGHATMTGNRIRDFERWPDGGRRPPVESLAILAAIYGTRIRRLLSDEEFALYTSTQQTAIDDADRDQQRTPTIDEKPDFPVPIPSPKLADALNVTAEGPPSLLDDVVIVQSETSERMSYVFEHPSSVDLVAVAYLHERIRQLDGSYDKSPSTALLGPAGQVHGQVKYLREHVASVRVRKALFEVEAESATFMGKLVWDVSQRRDHEGPITYLDEAINASGQVRDPYIGSYAVLRKSFVALYGEKDPVKGLTLAQEAAEVAKICSPSLTGLSYLHVAEGYAMTGDLKSCEEALKKAEAQFDRVDELDLAAGYFTENEFNRLAGSCYLYLDRPGRAEPLLIQTIKALVSKKKSQAIALGNLSISLIRQRKLEEAAHTLHRTIDAVELTRGGGGLNLAFAAGRELKEWRSEPWVQDINDRLLALIAAL